MINIELFIKLCLKGTVERVVLFDAYGVKKATYKTEDDMKDDIFYYSTRFTFRIEEDSVKIEELYADIEELDLLYQVIIGFETEDGKVLYKDAQDELKKELHRILMELICNLSYRENIENRIKYIKYYRLANNCTLIEAMNHIDKVLNISEK